MAGAESAEEAEAGTGSVARRGPQGTVAETGGRRRQETGGRSRQEAGGRNRHKAGDRSRHEED